MKRTLFSLVAATALVASCTPKEERFESVCQIVHRETVEVDDKGEPKVVDYELEWDPCPGDQFRSSAATRRSPSACPSTTSASWCT